MISSIKSFTELSVNELYDLIALRAEIFIVEQQCLYQDLDNLDQKAQHLQIRKHSQLIAYARILPYEQSTSMSFGRLLIKAPYRKQGLGQQLMEMILSYLSEHHSQQTITIKAQLHLQNFYEHFDFLAKGKSFALDGIPHILMEKQP
ncbi:MAG: GNAT family N-acetyltransferase [Tatlockia sp.]|nr:GNAT family N-acetyltransferase [Tatlockia sp.]